MVFCSVGVFEDKVLGASVVNDRTHDDSSLEEINLKRNIN